MMSFKKFIEAQWFHGSHEDFDQWTPEGAKKTSGRQGLDSIGQWLTSSEKAARNYGPKIYQYDLELKNPHLMTDHYFNRAFYFPEVAQKFLTPQEFRIMSKRPEMEQVVALSKKRQSEGGFFNDYREEDRYIKLEKHIQKFDKIAYKLYRQTDYVKALREHLQSRGYDGILWRNSHIDFHDIEHDVAVIFNAEQHKYTKKLN
jgi:hypothetical protein